ncbi:MAG: hypothetical protein WCK93_07555 [Nitrosomonadales bacterium]
MKSIKLTGSGINDWFAEQLVKDLGADKAREKTCGPSREAVERVIKRAENKIHQRVAVSTQLNGSKAS